MKRTALAVLLGLVLVAWPAASDPEVVQEATGELTMLGGASGPDFWTRIYGIISFGPEAVASSDGTLDATHGRGCIVVGTSFWNSVYVCHPFAPGEVVLVHNPNEQAAGVLLVNTMGRLDEDQRAVAVMPMHDEDVPSISPLTPIFWLPSVTPYADEDRVQVDVTEYESDFFDVRAAFVSVNGVNAIIPSGSGILLRHVSVSDQLYP